MARLSREFPVDVSESLGLVCADDGRRSTGADASFALTVFGGDS